MCICILIYIVLVDIWYCFFCVGRRNMFFWVSYKFKLYSSYSSYFGYEKIYYIRNFVIIIKEYIKY